LKPYEEAVFLTTTLYQIAGQQFVFKQAIPNVGRKLVPSGNKERGADYLTVKVTDGKESKMVQLEGGINMIGKPMFFTLNGLNYHLEYGSKRIKTPFYVKCLDFKLDRYPGSDMPSSYASDLQIMDTAKNEFGTKHVFMNHVLDYRGYRLFQSSYDPDEQGTILSVNHDFWGTNITYLGYLMMTIGMVFNVFSRNSRFREMLNNLSKSGAKVTSLLVFVLASFIGMAQHDHNHDHDHEQTHDHAHDHASHADQPQGPVKKPVAYFMSEEHSDELATLIVQDNKGRYIPMHTLCTQLLNKMYRSNEFENHNAIQVILSMQMYPDYWVDKKIIQVPSAVKSAYNLDSYVSLKQLMDPQGNFIYLKEYNEALQKAETKQSETQKKLIKLGEKFQVFLQVINWKFMHVIPLKGDVGHHWYSPFSPELMQVDSIGSKLTLDYITSIDENAKNKGDFSKSLTLLNQLKEFQRKNGVDLPSETALKIEVSYNKMGIFKNSMNSYLFLGFVTMILFFMELLGNESEKRLKRIGIVRKIFIGLIAVFFVYHASGLGMRSFITGQAPWSDGYEAIVYIAWVAMLAGLLFSGKHRVVIPAATIIASILLMVTELNLLDPEITPLVPVLKSYWLMIHVAVITSSYAFLAISFILGWVNLIIYIFRDKKNGKKLTRNINEITYVSEMSMTIGLFMLAIGTFLGGIWANESWGRYWGWDPKETWALVSVLVYAIVMHFRYIPGLKSKFVFNVASLWAFAAIIFTFLGVNFILVGLHSYANGDGAVAFPPSVWITVAIFLILSIVAGIRNKAYQKQIRAEI
jgi:cytochrome c-type biogenesis protein CcsB